MREHPHFQDLLANKNYFWDRMLASVSKPSTVLGELVMLRGAADETNEQVRQLQNELAEIKRTLLKPQAQRSADPCRPPPARTGQPDTTKPKPRIEIPPSVRRSRKAAR